MSQYAYYKVIITNKSVRELLPFYCCYRACVREKVFSFQLDEPEIPVAQPIEVPSLRIALRELMGHAGFPQLVFRMGYGPDVPATPRGA